MRTLLLFGTIVFSCATAAVAQTPQEPLAQDAIRATMGAYATSWNNVDATSLAALYTEAGDYTGFGSVMTRGRADIQSHYQALLNGAYLGSQLTIGVSSIRFLKPDVALVDGALELSGLRNPDGSTQPQSSGMYVVIMTQEGGRWLLTSFWAKKLTAPATSGN